MVSSTERAWAAGVWDAEGTCYVQTARFPGREYRYARASLTSTDRALVVRFHSVVNVGVLKQRAPRAPLSRLAQHSLQIDAQGDVRALARMLYPYLGEHRRAQFDAVLEAAIGRVLSTRKEVPS